MASDQTDWLPGRADPFSFGSSQAASRSVMPTWWRTRLSGCASAVNRGAERLGSISPWVAAYLLVSRTVTRAADQAPPSVISDVPAAAIPNVGTLYAVFDAACFA